MKTHSFQINQYYRLTWQLLLLTSCILGVASQVARPMVLAGYFLLATLMISQPAHQWLRHRRALGLAIGGSLLILVSQQALSITNTEGFVSILIEIISGSLPWLLISHDRYRSYWLAILNTTVITIGAMTAGSTSLIYLGFLIFITLMMLNLNAANLYFSALETQGRRDALPRGYFRQFVYVIPVGILAGIVIFLFFPRVQSFSWSITRGRGDNYTGYTGLVNLSADGELQLSHALNLMVESQDEDWLKSSASSLLMRGDSLDSFDGVRWHNTMATFKAAHRTTDSELDSGQSATIKKARIHLEPSILNTIFYPGTLLSIRSVDTPNVHFLSSSHGQVIRDPHAVDRLSYEVQFIPAASIADQTRRKSHQVVISDEDRARYLTIPAAIKDAKFFKDWLTEVGTGGEYTQLEQLTIRIEDLFRRHYRSTLANSFSGTNALEAFLVIDRRGHCEYFATATVLALRAFGFPARLVVGYRGGLYNTMLGTLDVRDEDAHAWVEVFSPDHGWVPFDPTPTTDDPTSLYRTRWQMLTNSLNFWLHRYVIDYDQATQKELWQELRNFGHKTSDLTPEFGSIPPRYMLMGGAGLVCVLIYIFLRSRGMRHGALAVPSYYLLFTRSVGKLGLKRRTGESFSAFHQRASQAIEDASQLNLVDRALHEDLYAANPRTIPERAQLLRELRRWRPRLRKRHSL
ncbi:MAG: DUF3488 domain-containing protein [Deltaproteobacteria bacterium]|nr:DUF3488 domain-containing protein [Deltaproteobacteria bacterium]